MAGNSNLNSAKTARKDEFYTQLTDIEKEMRYYRKHFQGKTVLCNCDDPFESNDNASTNSRTGSGRTPDQILKLNRCL